MSGATPGVAEASEATCMYLKFVLISVDALQCPCVSTNNIFGEVSIHGMSSAVNRA